MSVGCANPPASGEAEPAAEEQAAPGLAVLLPLRKVSPSLPTVPRRAGLAESADVSRASPAVSQETEPVLAALLGVQAALSNLGGQLAEQHRELTTQLGLLSMSERELPGALPPLQLEPLKVAPEPPQRSSVDTETAAPQLPSTVSAGFKEEASTTLTKRMVSVAMGREVSTALPAHMRTSVLAWRQVAADVGQGLLREAVMRILYWDGFDRAIGFIIFLNAVVIGVEIEQHARNELSGHTKTILSVSETFFLIVYAVELWMRFYVDHRSAMRNGWIIFDLILVVVGVGTQIISSLVSMTSSLSVLQQLTLLRVMRLLRLVRAVRMIKQFKTLWRLVNGLLTSWDAILSTLALILLVLYVASCIGVELITNSEALESAMSHNSGLEQAVGQFRSLGSSMLMLVRFVTADSLSSVYEPIILEQPLFVFYFMGLLMIISISLLNLITAVLVEGALDKAKQDKEMVALNLQKKVKEHVPLARQLFRCIDTSGDGIITLCEIKSCLAEGDQEAKVLCHKLNKVVPFESVLELFEILDTNGDGEISEDEFVQGVLKTALGDQNNLEITQVLKLMRVLARKVQALDASAAPKSACFKSI